MFLLDKINHLPFFNGNVKMLFCCKFLPVHSSWHFHWLCHLVLVGLFLRSFLICLVFVMEFII